MGLYLSVLLSVHLDPTSCFQHFCKDKSKYSQWNLIFFLISMGKQKLGSKKKGKKRIKLQCSTKGREATFLPVIGWVEKSRVQEIRILLELISKE